MEIIPIIVRVLALGAIFLVVIVFISFIISKFRRKDTSYDNQFSTYPNANFRDQFEQNKTLKLKIETTDDKAKKNGNAEDTKDATANGEQKSTNTKPEGDIKPRYTILNEKQKFKNNYDILDLNFRSYNSDNPL